jgi:hypothetical protein
MLTIRRFSLLAVAIAAATIVHAAAPSAEAGLFFRRTMPAVPADAVLPEPVGAGYSAPMGYSTQMPTSFSTSTVVSADYVPACCPTPCISYRHLGLFKVKSCSKVSMNLVAVNPCTCCPVCVPVCLPACCDMCPSVSCRKALFGDGVVTYAWSSGVKVHVRFQRTGNVLVTYYRA